MSLWMKQIGVYVQYNFLALTLWLGVHEPLWSELHPEAEHAQDTAGEEPQGHRQHPHLHPGHHQQAGQPPETPQTNRKL